MNGGRWHMIGLLRNPGIRSALFVAGVIAAAELVWLAMNVGAAAEAGRQLQQARHALHMQLAANSNPTVELDAQLAQAAREVSVLRAELGGQGAAAARWREAAIPASRADAFFEFAAFKERMRERARSRGVDVDADEGFGFSSYAHAGPELKEIRDAVQQRLVAERLLEIVFDSGARELLSIRREPLDTGASSLNSIATAGAGADFFAMDPRFSIRRLGFADARAFRVAFTGETAALRNVLNALGASELPLVVRAVEVEPAASPRPISGAATSGPSSAPLVPHTLSQFTVTLVFIPFSDPLFTTN